jgi:hypothetical protein
VDVRQDLSHGVGRSLKPLRAFGRLFGGEDFDEAVGEAAEAIGARDVAIERRGVVLREHENLRDVRVDAVRDRDVHEAILAAERHGGLGTLVRQGKQARACAAAEDDRQHLMSRRHHLFTVG